MCPCALDLSNWIRTEKKKLMRHREKAKAAAEDAKNEAEISKKAKDAMSPEDAADSGHGKKSKRSQNDEGNYSHVIYDHSSVRLARMQSLVMIYQRNAPRDK